MHPALTRYATAAVPRYTSYPTAPHFRADFAPATYREWLAATELTAPISLYLHVPFCRQICWYCGCNMKLAARYAPLEAYVESLLDEIALVCAILPGRATVGHLHWGGGTPTALSPDDLARVMAELRRRFEFADNAELAIESDPRTLTPEMARRIGELGFTRASFGVQEFDAVVQRAINRIQPPEMVRAAVDCLREAGVSGINFDLIYGLPHQSVATLVRTVDTCAAMQPDRLALFGYAHVPWMAKRQRLIREEALPGVAARTAQADAARERLLGAGYEAVGLDHFALPGDRLAAAARAGTLRRNFQGYTTDRMATLIGLGASAIGKFPGGYVQNLSETGAWARAIAAGELPVARGHALSDNDRLRGHVIERLMCDGAVDTAEATRRFGARADWCAGALASLGAMAEDGLVKIDADRVCVTARGRPFVRLVAAAFDDYLPQASARHAAAV